MNPNEPYAEPFHVGRNRSELWEFLVTLPIEPVVRRAEGRDHPSGAPCRLLVSDLHYRTQTPLSALVAEARKLGIGIVTWNDRGQGRCMAIEGRSWALVQQLGCDYVRGGIGAVGRALKHPEP